MNEEAACDWLTKLPIGCSGGTLKSANITLSLDWHELQFLQPRSLPGFGFVKDLTLSDLLALQDLPLTEFQGHPEHERTIFAPALLLYLCDQM